MAKGRSNILTVAALVGGFLFLPGLVGAVNVGNNMVTRFRGVRFRRVVGTFPSFRLEMDILMNVVNPTRSAASIDFVDLQMRTANGAPFADVTRTNANYAIPPRGSVEVSVPFELNLTNSILAVVFPAVLDLIRNRGNVPAGDISERLRAALPPSVSVTGNLRVNNFRVPVNQTIAVIK